VLSSGGGDAFTLYHSPMIVFRRDDTAQSKTIAKVSSGGK